MSATTEQLAKELDELGTHMALGPNQSATLRAAAARLRELEASNTAYGAAVEIIGKDVSRATAQAHFLGAPGATLAGDVHVRPTDCSKHDRARITSAADAIMALDGWQTIDSAPRDGRSILAAGGGLGCAVDVVSYSPSVGCWNCSAVTLDDVDDEPDGYNRPAHWRHLPQPPGDAG